MELGERFRGGGTRGIARFLAEHQNHDGGFDVQRDQEPGSGRLKIACLGCGQSIAYRAGETMALEADEPVPNGAVAPIPAPPSPEPARAAPPRTHFSPQGPKTQSERPPGASSPPRARGAAQRRGRGRGAPETGVAPSRRPPPPAEGRGIRGWLPIVLIGLLILGGVGMIVAGFLREDEQPAATALPTPAPEQTTPAPEPEPAEPEPAEPPAAQPEPEPEPQPGASVPLRRQTFAGGRFSMGVPAGWKAGGNPAEGFSFEGPGSTAAVTVFFERGGRPAAQLAMLARDFLAQRHPGAEIGSPKPTRLANGPAARVTAVYDGGTEAAVALSSGGFAYLVLERVDGGAPPAVGAQAAAVLASFKPR